LVAVEIQPSERREITHTGRKGRQLIGAENQLPERGETAYLEGKALQFVVVESQRSESCRELFYLRRETRQLVVAEG
jgi:hypothetical protein